jgi:hypothetical protein
MINIFQNRKLINSVTLREILDEIISPKIINRGLVWNGNYLWFSQPQNSIRHVFKYSKLKGETGTFEWGVCIDFVPTIFLNKLRFHRTDKSVQLLLFERTNEYSNSFFCRNFDGGITTHWGKQELNIQLITCLRNTNRESIIGLTTHI